MFMLVCATGVSLQLSAKPNIDKTNRTNERRGQLKTTASCKPAEAAIDLDINNVRARLMTGGDMWWDNGTSEARYEVPKGTRKNSLFAGSVWIGGLDEQKQLKVAAQTYRQDGNDYWPGPLNPATAEITESECSEWDRFWKVDRETINKFRALPSPDAAAGDPLYESIFQWPAVGNDAAVGRNGEKLFLYDGQTYAPFVDVDEDGVYDANLGDYPDIFGDQYIWWVFNDKGNVKQQSQTEGIGIEVQASAFAYSTKDFLNDATFYNYKLINRGNLSLDSTYIATWTDADLGYYRDDYIGCDTTRGLGILYNGRSQDGEGQVNSYGTRIPMVGVDFFKGPIKYETDASGKIDTIQLQMEAFTYYNNDNTVIGNPNNGIEIYNYMSGSITNGQRFSNDFKGPNVPSQGYGDGPTTAFVFPGDPAVKSEWSECVCNNPVNDRRFIHSSGPFTLQPGVVNDITIGAVWVADVGGCPNTSFSKIRLADDLAQSLFDNNFQTIEGPEAPRLAIRELDRKLVFYLVNDSISNNFQERYGYDTAAKYRVAARKAVQTNNEDSLYQFEGYRVFQLKDRTITPADIFNDDGELNSDVAVQVFQSDIKNGIGRIINYNRNTEISDSTWEAVIKVNGADSGITHSFQLEIDQFAKTEDKRFVNYKNYYFVAVAYAYNNFDTFSINRADVTQEQPYLESSKGAGGAPLEVVAATPNPSFGDMGTVLNASYGEGVIIKRIEGRGNGGNRLELTDSAELIAVQGVPDVNNSGKLIHQAIHPTYKRGSGPVDITIVDPVALKPYDWELYFEGPVKSSNPAQGLDGDSTTWRLVNVSENEVIYGERNLGRLNEQILEKYGFSISAQQVLRPSENQEGGNNGLLNSDIFFEDPSNPWLAGVNDGETSSFNNWIRSGKNRADADDTLCNWDDFLLLDTVDQVYEKLLDRYSTTVGTWAPYGLAADETKSRCGFGVAFNPNITRIIGLPSVDVVITSDKSKWTKSLVLELQDDSSLVNGVEKFSIRSHRSWTGESDGNGRPVYASNPADTGFSWFPGYAINLETGERLNIFFGEDSWLKTHNGDDMIWNPTSTRFAGTSYPPTVINGGKHYIYVQNRRYDSCQSFISDLQNPSPIVKRGRFNSFAWVGLPILNAATNSQFKSIDEGLVPGNVRIRFQIGRPYDVYATNFNGGVLENDGKPLYKFTTKDVAPTRPTDNPNFDKEAYLSRIHAVPNPYYGYNSYEQNRYDTRVKIINLPQKATISIYALDGSLIRRLEKDNPNESFIDWDIRNAKSLPIASGMYLIHVDAEGIGEKVIRWFGAMRPVDITNY